MSLSGCRWTGGAGRGRRRRGGRRKDPGWCLWDSSAGATCRLRPHRGETRTGAVHVSVLSQRQAALEIGVVQVREGRRSRFPRVLGRP